MFPVLDLIRVLWAWKYQVLEVWMCSRPSWTLRATKNFFFFQEDTFVQQFLALFERILQFCRVKSFPWVFKKFQERSSYVTSNKKPPKVIQTTQRLFHRRKAWTSNVFNNRVSPSFGYGRLTKNWCFKNRFNDRESENLLDAHTRTQ